jgi:hypothetical protein
MMTKRRKKRLTGAPRPRRITNRPEEELHLAVAAWAETAILAPAVWWTNPNQKGTRSTYEQQLLVKMGVKPGIPDIFVLHNGLLLGPELKAPNPTLKSGKVSQRRPRLSDDQRAMHTRLLAAGAKTAVCQSIDEVEKFLRAFGVPLRASALKR